MSEKMLVLLEMAATLSPLLLGLTAALGIAARHQLQVMTGKPGHADKASSHSRKYVCMCTPQVGNINLFAQCMS